MRGHLTHLQKAQGTPDRINTHHTPWYLANGIKNCRPHKNLHMHVHSRFIHNCQNLDATKMTASRWRDELVHPDNGIVFSDEKERALRPWKVKGKPKCMLLSERSQFEKATHCIVPSV